MEIVYEKKLNAGLRMIMKIMKFQVHYLIVEPHSGTNNRLDEII